MEAAKMVKEYGMENDLLERVVKDSFFKMTKEEIMNLVDAKKFIGRAPGQIVDFIEHKIKPLLEENKEFLGEEVEINV